MSYLLGFDFGMKCIGVAVGQVLNTQAKPLTVLKAKQGVPPWQQIDQLCEEWMIKAFVVGFADGDDVPEVFKRAVLGFVQSLQQRYGMPVHLVDEHYTTQEARQRAQQLSSAKDRHDDIAAAIILESYLNQIRKDQD